MERDMHRYAPINTSHPESQYVDGKGPSRSDSNGDSADTSRSDRRQPYGNEDALMKDTFYLEHVGQVKTTLSNTDFVWTSIEDPVQELNASTLLCCRTVLKDTDGHLLVAEIFAVKALGLGPVNQAKFPMFGGFPAAPKQLHRVEVHTFLRSDGKWVPKVYVFGHTSEAVVQEWTQRIQDLLHEDSHRPKSLLVFVNPYGGKRSGVQTWKQVAPLFELAKIKVTVITTERAGHARDVMNRATKDELNALDGVIVVGGDGFFNEVVNGLVMHRHKAPAAIMPQMLNSFHKKRALLQQRNSNATVISNEQGGLKQLIAGDVNTSPESSSDQHPLLQNRSLPSLSEATIDQEGKDVSTGKSTSASGVGSEGQDTAVSAAKVQMRENEVREQAGVDSPGWSSISLTVPMRDGKGNFWQPTTATAEPDFGTNRKVDASGSAGTSFSNIKLENTSTCLENSNPSLRIGIIPAGSTDTVVISTTGSRDPLTSVLHIILGDSMPLDLVRITGWRKQREDSASEVPEVRYAASFAGYGFYGDVMRESEKLRWMGPARYDMAGFKVFMQHKIYEAEISFLDIPYNQSDPQPLMLQGPWSRNTSFKSRHDVPKKTVCVAHCAICASGFDFSHVLNSESDTEEAQRTQRIQAPIWRTIHTKFHSIGAAVMSCRNDKAPEGVAAHAHLADGLLHLILIRECSRPDYLRQLLRLARRGADPFNFSFVDYYKTPLFTFTTRGDKESVWSVDGELLSAQELTGQVFRGLVNLFARGPET